MFDPYIEEQLAVLRRIAERGLKHAQDTNAVFIDNYQHMLDEIHRTEEHLARVAQCPRAADSKSEGCGLASPPCAPIKMELDRSYYSIHARIYSWLEKNTSLRWNKGYSITFGYQSLEFPTHEEHEKFTAWLKDLKTGKFCGKIQREQVLDRALHRIGGSRYVCMKPQGHLDKCGDWEFMSQPEHARLNERKVTS